MTKFVSLLPFLVLFSCASPTPQAQRSERAETEHILVTYEVPHGVGQQIARVLNRNMRAVVGGDEKRSIGRAELLPNGHLVLLATPSIHKGIPQLLENLKNLPAPAATNAQMETWYVLVHGKHQSDTPIANPELRQVIEKAVGDSKNGIHLVEKMRVQTAPEEISRTMGTFFDATFMIQYKNGHLRAQIEVDGSYIPTNLRTNVYLKENQYLILGEAGVSIGDRAAQLLDVPEGSYTLLTVLKASTQSGV